MMKYLVLLLVIALVYALWRSQRQVPRDPPAAPRASSPDPEPMVRCARCGVHLPRSQALQHGDRSYCCQAHQQEE